MTRPVPETRRPRSRAWVLWVLLLLALAVIFWWFWAVPEDDVDVIADDTPTVAETDLAADRELGPPMEDEMVFVPVAEIVGTPVAWFDRDVIGEATVVDVPTDRGFWIEQDGARLFVILIDQPAEVPLDIEAGQTVRITGGELRRSAEPGEIEGRPLDDDTRGLMAEQEVFLVVDEAAVEIVEPA